MVEFEKLKEDLAVWVVVSERISVNLDDLPLVSVFQLLLHFAFINRFEFAGDDAWLIYCKKQRLRTAIRGAFNFKLAGSLSVIWLLLLG